MNRKGKTIRMNAALDENLPIKDSNSCKNCKFSNKLYEEIQQLKGIVESQNKIIMETLAEHSLLLKEVIYKDTIPDDLLAVFPLKSLEELKEIDEKICANNRRNYIKAIKTLLKGKLAKTLENVFCTDIIMSINVDGIHGKQGLKVYRHFFDSLLAAIDSSDPTHELRSALAIIKKRVFHKASCRKAAEKQRNVDSTALASP